MPFIQRFSLPPILGIAKITMRNNEHQKKVFFKEAIFNVLDIKSPAKKGNITRQKPILICSGVMDHPPTISPFGEVTAKWTKAIADKITKTLNAKFENFLTNNP